MTPIFLAGRLMGSMIACCECVDDQKGGFGFAL